MEHSVSAEFPGTDRYLTARLNSFGNCWLLIMNQKILVIWNYWKLWYMDMVKFMAVNELHSFRVSMII